MKFILFVEGHTEQKALPRFLKRWLDRRLDKNVGIQAVRFDGWSQLIKQSPVKAELYRRRQDVIAVIALMDLYGPTIYSDKNRGACECCDEARAKIEAKVGFPGFFHQFFAVHETEA